MSARKYLDIGKTEKLCGTKTRAGVGNVNEFECAEYDQESGLYHLTSKMNIKSWRNH